MTNKNRITFFEKPDGRLFSVKSLSSDKENFVSDFLYCNYLIEKSTTLEYCQELELNNPYLHAYTICLTKLGMDFLEIHKQVSKILTETYVDKKTDKLSIEIEEDFASLTDTDNSVKQIHDNNFSIVNIGKRGGLHEVMLEEKNPKPTSILEDNTYESLGAADHLDDHTDYILTKF